MVQRRLALGLDLSTQSLSAIIIDIDSRKKIFEYQLDYAEDDRLNGYGIRKTDYIIPPRTQGEADQPPEMYFSSFDAIFGDLKRSEVPLEDVVVINASGQQHGHIYLNNNARSIFNKLMRKGSGSSDLVSLLAGCLAYDRAPIWMTSNTAEQADFIRNYVGGKQTMIQLSGSDAPLRFTGTIIRRIAEQFPGFYEKTENIQLISSLIPAILTGNSMVPIDYGNACGTSLMDYRNKEWSDLLIKATSNGLIGREDTLRGKLPPLTSPDTIVGAISTYFIEKYGFSKGCKIVAGSGDNPQSKVPVSGDLLSLGTSLVNMISTDGDTFDMNGFANAMYDGIGRPFIFGCRTNGAMVWDQLRAMYGMKKEEYTKAEEALQQTPVARHMVFWQPKNESFPPSGIFDLFRVNNQEQNLEGDYSGLIESSLASIYEHSKGFAKETSSPLFVCGGATGSPGIMRRIAAIWNRPIIPMEKGSAALGAAIAGVYAFFKSEGENSDIAVLCESLLETRRVISPTPGDIEAYHGADGYLAKFVAEESKLIKAYPNI